MTATEGLTAELDARAAALPEVERSAGAGGVEYRVRGAAVCVVGADGASFRLGDAVARAATKTPDTADSPRGRDWVRFAPATLDRFALDRATSWFDLAVRLGGARAQA